MSRARDMTPLVVPSAAALAMPGSKSEANRLLVAAALSGGTVTVHGATPSDDVRHLVAGLRTLGYAASFVGDDRVTVGPRTANAATRGELFCGNAGTALRFLVSVAAITPGEWVVTGDKHMRRRPIQPLVDAWRQLGIEMHASGGCPPVHVRGGLVAGGHASVEGSISSQFVSSLLLVGARLPNGLRLTFAGPLASRRYADWTVAALQRFGIDATLAAGHARVAAGYGDVPDTIDVGGDWSSMGVWTCLNHLHGSRVTAPDLRSASGQPDERLAEVLAGMVGRGELVVDVADVPDQFPNLAVVAALRPGVTTLTGAANLRHKECDRIAVMARELRRVGVPVDEHADGLRIIGGGAIRGAMIDPEQDHRIAMACTLLGLLRPGIAIDEPDCVTKSYPTFWADVERVRTEHLPIAVVGMRGAGKSTFGAALARRLGSEFVDTDRVFEAQHGAIAAFVASHDWPAFRAAEQRIVNAALAPGRVVATGGGAVESEAVRRCLRERAFVVHLRAPLALLRARIGDGSRPSLTGRPVADELEEVLARRAPLYDELAARTIDAADGVDADALVDRLSAPEA